MTKKQKNIFWQRKKKIFSYNLENSYIPFFKKSLIVFILFNCFSFISNQEIVWYKLEKEAKQISFYQEK